MVLAQLNITELVDGQASGFATANEALAILDAHCHLGVINRTQTNAPGSPTNGDRYLVASSGATGTFSGQGNNIAIYINGAWKFQTPKEGWTCWVNDEDLELMYTGSAWVATALVGAQLSITASVTQTQGQQPLTRQFNHVSVCANVNDVVTLPAAVARTVCYIFNRGAQTLQVFPASGDAIDGAAANASMTLAAGKSAMFFAVDTTNWYTLKSA